MIFLFLVIALAVPYFVGTATILIWGERRLRGPVRWSVGVLSLFACFLGCILISLWFDYDLYELCRLFGILSAALTAGSIPVFVFAATKREITFQNYDGKVLIWLVPAVILGIVSVFLLNPVYVNDITLETVKTTLASGKIYEVSSLLGIKMEAGLPIFNKIEIIPLLISVLARDFELEPEILINYMFPVATYTANMFIMWEISKLVCKEKDRNLFMLFHILILVAGTYLPKTAIPVSLGEPLLLQGYSGYAWAYGVVVPMVILMLLQKRFFLAAISGAPILGLMRYDRIFFAFKEFFTSYHLSNEAGKLWALYLIALLWMIVRKKKMSEKPLPLLLSGSALISSTLVEINSRLGKKKGFIIWAVVIIFACCSFTPFRGASFVYKEAAIDYDEITGETENVTIWAPEKVMNEMRRSDATLKPVYGRDLYENMIDGVNYEPVSEDAKKLYYAMSVIEGYMDDYVGNMVTDILMENEALAGVDVVVLPRERYSEQITNTLTELGFSHMDESDDYQIMRRYE